MMKVAIAADHAGYKLKEFLLSKLGNAIDLGTTDEKSVDYPDFAKLMADELKSHPDHMGILICGSGIGITIAANRYYHIRAALCRDFEDVRMSRLHNNANVLVLGGRVTDYQMAFEMADEFLRTEFEGGRHEQRINKMS